MTIFSLTVDGEKPYPIQVAQTGICAITITARCESGIDLKVQVDDLEFREIPPLKNKQTYDIPPAWNGTTLQGLSKTIVFVMVLKSGSHTLKFLSKGKAEVTKIDFSPVQELKPIIFDIHEQAQDGNQRPWYCFVLVDLPLQKITAEVVTEWRWRDGDDVQLKVDGKTQDNTQSSWQQAWLWCSGFFRKIRGLSTNTQSKTLETQLEVGTHYVEFLADRMPILNTVELNIGNVQLPRVPTKNDPDWTGDFNDDSDAMILARLIFGEARDQHTNAKVGVGWVVKNRLLTRRSYFGANYHEIITKHGKYYQFASMSPKDPNFAQLTYPLLDKANQNSWLESYDIAQRILDDAVADPTGGCTYFISADHSKKRFITHDVPGSRFIMQIDKMLFFKGKDDK